jgi:flagellar biosynthesis/type III secretory pathway ATPase
MNYRISAHAQLEMRRRKIAPDSLDQVMRAPDQIVPAANGRQVYQRHEQGDGKRYLLRAVVQRAESDSVVITVYRTSKIDKYWSAP